MGTSVRITAGSESASRSVGTRVAYAGRQTVLSLKTPQASFASMVISAVISLEIGQFSFAAFAASAN